MKDFMVGGYNKGRYKLKSLKTNRDKRDFKIKVNYMGRKIQQIHGILVGMGFKIAVSNRGDNFEGKNVLEYRPHRDKGYCIPDDFYRFDRYLKGGIYYDYRMISGFSRNGFYGGGRKIL